MYYKLGRAGRALDRFGVIEFATTIAPGVRDVLLTGKVYEAVQRNSRNKGATRYDAVVLDAPPTGRIAQFLNVNNELAGLAKVGPDQEPGRLGDDAVPLAAHGRPPGHRAGGDAGAGDRPTAIAELRAGAAARRRRGGQHGAAPGPDAEADLAAARTGRLDRARIAADLDGGRCRTRRPGWSTACSAEARDHAERRALEDAQRARRRRRSTCRPTSCPRLAGRRRPGRPLRARGAA